MLKQITRKSILLGSACAASLITGAFAEEFNIPAGNLNAALNAYSKQTGIPLIVSADMVRGASTRGVAGDLSPEEALTRILSGTGFSVYRDPAGALGIGRGKQSSDASDIRVQPMQLAQAAPSRAAVETVTVTSSKLGGADVQSIPIAITALSQEQLTATQTAGGPDLVKQVPNLTFTKTNFTGYSIQIRGIGTQAISVSTDPAVAVAFNDMPFIRNHFFEQEFYDVSNVEVLRGPQGTLYGRNATAGVVNLVSAKPTDHYEATASVDVGNYNNRRLEGMLNIPIVGDKLGIRAAGEWTKRDGYSFNSTAGKPVDGRDLWSTRLTIGFRPIEHFQAYLVWEHFEEDDDRLRTAKQLCKKDPGLQSVDDVSFAANPLLRAWTSQGCLPTSLYSADAFQTPNGQAIPIVAADEYVFNGVGGSNNGFLLNQVDPYSSTTQSRDLRVIESDLTPTYRSKNDVFELTANYSVTPELTLISQTGYNKDELRSTEDFNRFNTAPGLFADAATDPYDQNGFYRPVIAPGGVYCDPQMGCSTKMVGEDLSQERAWQFNQEFRLESNYDGPLNFSVGANYMHYQTLEDYYVFLNLITATTQITNGSSAGDYTHCYNGDPSNPDTYSTVISPTPFLMPIENFFGAPYQPLGYPSNYGCGAPTFNFPTGRPGTYIDPHSIDSLDGQGHNYFRSENPYRLNSYAGFGEVYYQVRPDLKLTAGLRWTDDEKWFEKIPSWVFLQGGGYPVDSVIRQQWKKWTGRLNATWTPKVDFTDQTLVYASFAHGYKGGGANPPGPQPTFTLLSAASKSNGNSVPTHPATFEPEYVNAYELGTKNTLMNGSLTLNADVFYYDYKGYQISQIVDRTSINLNFDARIKGAELESTWEPLPGLRFNFSGGYEDSSVNKGQSAIDLMDRTAGHTDWTIVHPFLTETSNCILPKNVVKAFADNYYSGGSNIFNPILDLCDAAYQMGVDPSSFTGSPVGFDPSTAPNGGAGFSKDLSGNKLPNTPPFTLSAGAQYSMPLSEDWAGTLRGDFYWQGNSFARIFNDKPYDQLHGYTNVNLALIFTNQDGWQAMLYAKNVFDTTAITGAFLNSDDTALTTNVFLTDPRLFGIRITKNW
jgi:outer membrane receptor protein involved in Fe transport